MNPPESAATGPVIMLFSIRPICEAQSFARHACKFEPDKPRKLQIVRGAAAAAGAAAGAARPGVARPAALAAAGAVPPAAAPAAGTWDHAFGEVARTSIESPATHVF